MRPTPGKFTNPSGLIDKRIGDKFAAVEGVHKNLDKVSHLSYYLEALFNLDQNLNLLASEGVDHHILKDVTVFQGASAFELALKNGYVGTEIEWLDSLQGLAGDTGPAGVLDDIVFIGLLDELSTNTSDTQFLKDTLTTITDNLNNVRDSNELSILNLTGTLADVESSIPSSTSILNSVNSVLEPALAISTAAVTAVNTRIDATEQFVLLLRGDLEHNSTAFNSFLIQNDSTVLRLDVAEAALGINHAAITNLDTVTAELATIQTDLIAVSELNTANVSNLQMASAEAASNIVTLQARSVSNQASIADAQQVGSDNASAVLTLQAENINVFSSITNLNRVSGGNATQLNALSVISDNNASSISNLDEVTENNATHITTLIAENAEQSGSISNLFTVTAYNTSNLLALESRTENSEGSIVNLQTTQATHVSDLSQLNVRSNSLENSLTSVQGSIETLSNVKADQDDLQVEVARTDALTARVTSNEGDLTNVSADISTLESTKADGVELTAEADRITALNARMVASEGDINIIEGDISSLESVKADASALAVETVKIDTITARLLVKPNILLNATFANGTADWSANAAWASAVVNDAGPQLQHNDLTAAAGANRTSLSAPLSIQVGEAYTISYDIFSETSGNFLYCDLLFYGPQGYIAGTSRPIIRVARSFGERLTSTLVAPAGSTYALVRFLTRTNVTGIQAIRRIKVERGEVATLWSDEASVTHASQTLASIENGLAARYGVQVKAGTGSAELELIALDGSEVGTLARLAGDKIILDGTLQAAHFADGSLYNLTETSGTDINLSQNEIEIAAQVFTSAGKTVRFDIGGLGVMGLDGLAGNQQNAIGIQGFEVWLSLYRDGALITSGERFCDLMSFSPDGGGTHVKSPSRRGTLTLTDNPGAGVHLYSLRAQYIWNVFQAQFTVTPKLIGVEMLIAEIDN